MSYYRLFLFTLFSLIIILFIQFLPASASYDSRIRADIDRLNARVSRLESSILNLRQQRDFSDSPPISSSPQIVDGELIGRSDPMFERLSTLVIELKERVMTLEKRMNELAN